MAQVIDSLFLELGMDTRKLEEGARSTLVTLQEFKKQLAETGETAQKGMAKAGDAFLALRGGIFGIVAALGVAKIGEFVEKVLMMDAATSRLARSIGMNTRELSVWQGVLKQVGGTAESANSFFESLADSLADIRLGISMPSGPFAFVMQQMGLDVRRSTPEQIAERIPSFVQQQRAGGMDELRIRGMLRQIPGMNDAAIFAAMSGNFAEMRRSIETIGPLTRGQGEAAEKLAAKQSLVETAFDRLASKSFPALEAAVEGLTAAFRGSLGAFNALAGGRATPAATSHPAASANNPGRVPYGQLAARLGAVGADRGGWAIFPSPAAGEAAARAFEGLGGDKTPTFRGSATEGTFRNRFPVPGPQSSLGGRGGGGTVVNVAAINVTSSRADPRQVAAAIPTELRRLVMVVPHDSALTG